MLHQISVSALYVFKDPKNTSNQYQSTKDIERPKLGFPIEFRIERLSSGTLMHANFKHHRCENEKTKHQDLDEETNNNNVATHFGIASGNHETGSSTLDQKWENVAGNKDFREPIDANERVCFGVYTSDDTTQNHINRRREQGWAEEEEDVLHSVWHYRACLMMRGGSASITNHLDYYFY